MKGDYFMQTKEKPAPGDCSTKSGKETRISGQAVDISVADNIIGKAQKQGIAAFFPEGEENAISTNELLRITGLSSARQLQKIIERERDQGGVILSSTGGGYFSPSEGEKGRQELRRFVNTIRARAANTLKAAKPAEKALQEREG